ncbi:cobalamin-binding protein [candidate division KSB3 bacterium]|uniref:Cobalamin-binding protein n=1 Tax=candidate division KSB3 bacterium TaxID=2044937 RepID=A0A2G6E7N0_9BACT|nr:MAG: cobalamin-binding protein [candidate division KSB3 bacterium]PIE30460.1 MAG: cobalamin-binding protein [candidate division KSB3 bacterium]
MASIDDIRESLIDGDMNAVTDGITQALDKGLGAADILSQGLIAGMTEVGQLFEEGEFFVPEMLIAARAMQAGVARLKPKLMEEDVKPLGTIVLGTVKGDLHDIGKNLVGMMLEGVGFEVIDLGTDVSPEKFVEAIQEHEAGFVGMSALLTTTMSSMKSCVEALKEAGIRDKVSVMIGGAPVTQNYADEIGADIYAPDGPSAARKVKEAIGAA